MNDKSFDELQLNLLKSLDTNIRFMLILMILIIILQGVMIFIR